MAPLVVVGASLAGLRAVEAARRAGHDGEVVLVGAEEHLPYDRPPLSKALLGSGEPAPPALLEEEALEELGVRLRLGAPATGLDLDAREVVLADGREPYGALVVATGARARPLPEHVPGRDLPGVHVLRTLDDARSVRRALDGGARTVVVGAGFVGSEVASAVRARGLPCTLVEAAPQPLVRALGAPVAGLLAALHERAGSDLRRGTSVVAVEGAGRVERVLLSDGAVLPADLVVVGTGAVPATEWLEGSGLGLDDGVLCDETLQAAPHVWAAGDVARFRTRSGATRRLEHWTAAADQGAVAGRNAVADLHAGTGSGTGSGSGSGARSEAYAPVPFVWTEWYGSPVHLLGDCTGEQPHLVGDPHGARWAALYRDGDAFVGAVTVGQPARTPKLRRRLGGPFSEALALLDG